MISTMIFDLDGTLVQTERLKAISYARAARILHPELEETAVIAAFKDVVGLSRREVTLGLMTRLGLTDYCFIVSRFGLLAYNQIAASPCSLHFLNYPTMTYSDNPPLLNTKLFVPVMRENLVERSRLHKQLDAGKNSKLILITAAAGSGKTTLVSSWLAAITLHTTLDAQRVLDLNCMASSLTKRMLR